MANNRLTIIILAISIVAFSTGAYLKFFKSYSDKKLQVETTNLAEDKTQRQLKLGEMITMLNKLESIQKEYEIESDENETALKCFKQINVILISMMILSLFAFIWSILKLRK